MIISAIFIINHAETNVDLEGVLIMAKKINYCKDKDDAMDKYREYINIHVLNVRKAYDKAIEAFKEIFPDVYENNIYENILLINLQQHDQSKYGPNEFWEYANRFFPIKGTDPESDEVKKNFQIAWLHHAHTNPHHPSYWVLVDNGGVQIFDMPDIYIIEMLCDWMAMSKYYNSTTLEYWNTESARKLPMSVTTRAKVNEFMEWMQKNNVHTLW